jgi:hypothetical protein
VESRLQIHQHATHVEGALFGQRPALHAQHDQERPPYRDVVDARQQHARRWIPKLGERVLGGALPQRARRSMTSAEPSQDQWLRPPRARPRHPEGKDVRVVATRDRGGRLREREIRPLELGAQVLEEPRRQVAVGAHG